MLLPNEWIENSIETYIYQHTTKSQIIYLVVLMAITVTIAFLPFIYVDISIQGSGLVRPIVEKTQITSPITELVDSVYVSEGEQVEKGDVILKFRTNDSDYKIDYQSNRLFDYESHLADLVYLTKGKRTPIFHSPARQQEYVYFLKKKNELEITTGQAKIEWLRNKALYDTKVISEDEYDNYYFQYQNKQNELASLIESQLSTWQADMNSYKNESGEMHTNLKETRKNKDLYIVRSPVSGTIDQFTGIYKGSSLQVGQNVAIVSPNSALYIEVYVTPRNIGFLNVGMPVKVQIESFNYNEWGTIPGVVKEISSDYMTDDKGNSYYKVKCQLKRNFLVLKKTNRRGYLKKGMTVNAHFLVTRCSLFNLLYQEIDEWANPSQYSSKEKTGKIKQNSNS